jgi:hypothetical protein
LAYYDGGHAFLFQQYGRFAETVNAFLKWIRFRAVLSATFGWFFPLLLTDSYESLAATAEVAPAPKTIIIEAT